ncbi:Sodium/hydrogen exchanger family-domain-containing protein [Mycena floridula]|nr:Sodium/hydrogen exchanger family-domain-containing protein [Mycena floridula]
MMDSFSQLVARAASGQGGVFSGDNPSTYNASDPIRLWVIQVVVIIGMTQLLSLIFARIRQPRVIAEVIGGVLLGPTVMGRIPGFRNAIFPDTAMPLLNLTANIGLVLFLFLVGLEIDVRLMRRNIKAAAVISVAGLLVPLGLGAALGVGVYREFINPAVNFGYFLLFTAVAVGITAFPVLCRILTELKLLDTTVGVVVLSAGVGNDVVGWVLLALTVALVNASSGLTALYVLLTGIGFVIFLLYPGRWAYIWLARRTGSLEQGSPTPLMMTITILLVFASAFFTDIIGIHAIFGGFLAGLIIPHENGFAISLVEKLEDLVSILFLPLYFTLSGLRTNLGLLDNGITWGYTIIICLVAFASKFLACAISAKLMGFNIRESGAIGSLMSCKGLVELIVLNVGLQAGILDTRTFSMFVVHAIILTFMTTPLVLLFYPSKYRTHEGIHAVKEGPGAIESKPRKSYSEDGVKSKFAFVLDKIEQLPAAMALSQLLQPVNSASASTLVLNADQRPITINALRLIELTNRTSAVFKSQEAEALLHNDPVLSVFRTFGFLNRLFVSATLSVLTHDEYASAIANHVNETGSQMVVLPWSRGTTSALDEGTTTNNPFDGVRNNTHDQTSSVVYSEYIRNVFLNSPADVALFVDRGLNVNYTAGDKGQHLLMPFFGGPDDRVALNFLVQLCRSSDLSATVVRIFKIEDDLSPSPTNEKEGLSRLVNATVAAADTVYGQPDTEFRLASDTADNLIWDRYTRTESLSRITFNQKQSPSPLSAVIQFVSDEASTVGAGKNLIVVTGRSRRMAVESHKAELTKLIADSPSSIGSSVPKTLGDVGAALVAAGAKANLLIVQAAI